MNGRLEDWGMLKQRKPTLFFPFLMAVLVVVLAVWLFYALSTSNLLWFQPPERSYDPGRIVIHYYGRTTELEPGSEEFGEVTNALNHSLGNFRGRVAVGLSEGTWSWKMPNRLSQLLTTWDIPFSDHLQQAGYRSPATHQKQLRSWLNAASSLLLPYIDCDRMHIVKNGRYSLGKTGPTYG